VLDASPPRQAIPSRPGSGAIGDVTVSRRTWRGRLRLAAIRRWADAVITLTDVMRAEALSAGIPAERIRIINNGIDVGSYKNDILKADAKQALGLDQKVIALFVGRVEPVKSLSTVLDALATALDFCPALHLMIIGDGSKRIPLEGQARSLGINEHITFAGNQKDIRPYLQAADMFVLPSLTEGISNALLEAMASGLACLATPVGGNLDVLDQGKYGMLISAQNVSAWADALVALGNDSEKRRRLGEVARQRVLADYDFTVVGACYEALYAELLENSKIHASEVTQND